MRNNSKLLQLLKFLFDKNIPFREKILIIVLLIYILSPIDLIPAPIFGFSILDDLVVFIYLMSVLNNKINKYYKNKNENIDKEKIVESCEYEVKEE